jgi:predicted transcriptional regulator
MKPLGELEALVMDVAWTGGALTVREVCDRLEGDDSRAYTTIMTTMDRLFSKGLLSRVKDGQAWRYHPTQSRAAFEHALADCLATEILNAHGEVGLVAFVDAASADPAMLDRLEALIAARREQA